MRTMNGTMSNVREDTKTTDDCVLIAPAEVLAAVDTLALQIGSVLETWPEPRPASGLVVCLPGMSVPELPPGWAGVWARPETPPVGAWVPLPGIAAADSQALAHALRAADAWRRERLQSAQHA
jgi:hypothetical protein